MCLTKPVTKGILPEVFEGGDKYAQAKEHLYRDAANLGHAEIWDEMDLGKLKSLQLQEIIGKRREAEVEPRSRRL